MFARRDKYSDDFRWCNACQCKHHDLYDCPIEEAWDEWHREDTVDEDSQYAWLKRGKFLASLTRSTYTVICPSCGQATQNTEPYQTECASCQFADQGESDE